jgi:Chaperone of endosialidase
MTHSSKTSLLLIGGLVAFGGSAQSAQPPDVVQSDANWNTAMGGSALYYLTSGFGNTASGSGALFSNTTGSRNTASGLESLNYNTTGGSNTVSGANALEMNTSGSANSAFGDDSLYFNSTGYNNTASGAGSLQSNTSGDENAAFGENSLINNTTGNNNTACGAASLFSNTTGIGNIAVGYFAGQYLTSGNNNIDIGNNGVAGEGGTIRIGAAGSQTATYIAGIFNTKLEGSEVVISKTGQLGVLASSERYKTGIQTMGPNSAKLQQLRPVTFHLKTNPQGALQYGLIAEEVDTVYPDLVIRDEEGKIQGVRYDELAPMLLNEVQLLQQKITAQSDVIAAQGNQLRDMQQQFAELLALNQTMQATLLKLQTKSERVAKL